MRVKASGAAVTLGDEIDFDLDLQTVAIRVTSKFGSMMDTCQAAAAQAENHGYRRASLEASQAFLGKLVAQTPAENRPRVAIVSTVGSNGSTKISVAYADEDAPAFAPLERKYAERTTAPDEYFLLVLKK
jgi:hypothetical protein